MINQFGYALLCTEKKDEAIAAFEQNVKLYTKSANVYDSLAEALKKERGQVRSVGKLRKSV